MRDFWDERAREDAFHFVDNRQRYRHTDAERFWRRGRAGPRRRCSGRSALAVGPHDRVLDLGCGVGPPHPRPGRARRARDRARRLARDARARPGAQPAAWTTSSGCSATARRSTGIEDALARRASSRTSCSSTSRARRSSSATSPSSRACSRPGGWAAFGLSTDPRVHEPRERRAAAEPARLLPGARRPDARRPGRARVARRVRPARRAAARPPMQAGLELEQIEGSEHPVHARRAPRLADAPWRRVDFWPRRGPARHAAGERGATLGARERLVVRLCGHKSQPALIAVLAERQHGRGRARSAPGPRAERRARIARRAGDGRLASTPPRRLRGRALERRAAGVGRLAAVLACGARRAPQPRDGRGSWDDPAETRRRAST